MPPKRNNLHTPPRPARRGGANTQPPPVMTWPKASPVLIVAGLFDLLRAFFEQFWFFGPALAAIYCTSTANGALGTSISESTGQAVAIGCSTVAATAGAAISETTTALGVIMADAVALASFLILGLWIVLTNARLIKKIATAPLWFSAALGVGAVPFVGSFPIFSVVLWRLYKAQIAVEKKELKKWEKENADAQLKERNQNILEFQQARATQLEQAEQQEAENKEIPEDVRMAA